MTIFQATVTALYPASIVSSLFLLVFAVVVEWQIAVSIFFFNGRKELEEIITFRKQYEGCDFSEIDVKSALTDEDIKRLGVRKGTDLTKINI